VRAVLIAGAQVILEKRAWHRLKRPALVLVVWHQVFRDDAVGRYAKPFRETRDVLIVQQGRFVPAAVRTGLAVELRRRLPVKLVDDGVNPV
jgi:hypothetical protein